MKYHALHSLPLSGCLALLKLLGTTLSMQEKCYDISTRFINKAVVSLKQQPGFGNWL